MRSKEVRGATAMPASHLAKDHRQSEACSRPLSQLLLNALLESQGGWDVHSCKCSGYLDKRLPRLNVLRQGLPVRT